LELRCKRDDNTAVSHVRQSSQGPGGKITRYRQLLPLAFAAMLLLSGCELADVIEVAVSGPHCGRSGIPPELEERGLNLFGHAPEPMSRDQFGRVFDPDRLDNAIIAVLEPYEDSHGPDVLFALGLTYVRKAGTLPDNPAYYRRGERLLAWAALCGQPLAAYYLGSFYEERLPGVDKDPELGACLIRLHDLDNYEPHLIIRAQFAGRVWACGLRLENFPE